MNKKSQPALQLRRLASLSVSSNVMLSEAFHLPVTEILSCEFQKS